MLDADDIKVITRMASNVGYDYGIALHGEDAPPYVYDGKEYSELSDVVRLTEELAHYAVSGDKAKFQAGETASYWKKITEDPTLSMDARAVRHREALAVTNRVLAVYGIPYPDNGFILGDHGHLFVQLILSIYTNELIRLRRNAASNEALREVFDRILTGQESRCLDNPTDKSAVVDALVGPVRPAA